MRIQHTTGKDLRDALTKVNEKYDNNIIFNRFEPNRSGYNVTLKCKNSKGKGSKRGFTGRRLISACWHVHGDFFEALLKINPSVIIKTTIRGETQKIYSQNGQIYGNWEDWNIGSIMQTFYYSEACECS